MWDYWESISINRDFSVQKLEPVSSLDQVAKQSNSDYEFTADAPVDLLEENVETLITAAFQIVFNKFDLMLVSRQRALFQTADLIAIDRVGRLSIFELKAQKVQSAEIIAQATQYLVETGQLTPTQIAVMFEDFFRDLIRSIHYIMSPFSIG